MPFLQLEVKDHIREAQKKKAYDPKKSVWVPNPAKDVGGYFEGISEEEIKYDTFSAGKKLAVNVNGEVKLHYLARKTKFTFHKIAIQWQFCVDISVCNL